MTHLLDLETLRALPSDVMEVADPCIYFLWQDDELLYVGGTTQSCDRIARHIRDRNYKNAQSGRPIPFNRYTFLEVAERHALWKLETEYQRFYEPPYNDVGPQRRRWVPAEDSPAQPTGDA